MNEQEKYEVIKSLVDNDGNKFRAAIKLGCTIRQVNRMIVKYKKEGKSAFIHGNKGRKPAHALSEKEILDIITIYNNKYWDATFSHACELLEAHDGIKISSTTLTNILYEEFILSPISTRKTKQRIKKKLKELSKNAKSKKEKEHLETSIVAIEDSHSRRPRCAYFGEMQQMDASVHEWFGEGKHHLHISIDDSTGNLTGAYFDKQETLNGYYNVLHQILNTHGIPAMFYTDKRTVFEYKRLNTNKVEKDTFTQFGYACNQLDIEIKTTSMAQAKGRVERAFQTLQQRLPIELRLAGISTIDEANVFLNSYIKKYNDKFALPINYNKSVFIPQPNSETINNTLAVIAERTIDSGHCIRFNKEYYKTMDSRGLQVHYLKGTKGLVIKTFDPRKRNIPSPKHPWRSESFLKYRYHKLNNEIFTL
ncbi:MAG TPA: ISNCY family transposase [Clostridiales bacterium]|nr:ISNCY family transposase [Clostridiales bacterium]